MDRIKLMWSLYAGAYPSDCEMVYLQARAQAIKAAMGAYRSQVDLKDRREGSAQTGTSGSRRDGWASAQGTQQSTRFADALSTMRYEDSAYGNAQSGSNSTSWSTSYDDSYSDFRDTGAGASMADSEGNRRGGAHTKQESQSDSDGKTDGAGERGGCTYRYSKSTQDNEVLFGILHTDKYGARLSGTDNFSCNKAFSYQTDERNGISERHVHGGSFSHSDSSRMSSSFFQAHVDQSATRAGASRGEAHSTSFRDSRAHSEGAGAGQGETLGQSQQSAQATATGNDESESHRRTDRSAFAVLTERKAQQRFKHLLDMYDNTVEMISIKRRQATGRMRGVVGQYVIDTQAGHCAAARKLALEAACYRGACGCSAMPVAASGGAYGAYKIEAVTHE